MAAIWNRLIAYTADGGIVMVPLIAVSLFMWVLILNRALFFRRLHRKNMPAAVAWDHIQAGKLPATGTYRGIVSLLVAEFLVARSGNKTLDRFLIDESIQRIRRHLKDHLALIGVLAAVAPLLGLLGTVTGMIATFDVLAFFGTGNAKAMASGISEALITTQTGLLVSIPGLYMKGFLEQRADNLDRRITRVGHYLKRQFYNPFQNLPSGSNPALEHDVQSSKY